MVKSYITENSAKKYYPIQSIETKNSWQKNYLESNVFIFLYNHLYKCPVPLPVVSGSWQVLMEVGWVLWSDSLHIVWKIIFVVLKPVVTLAKGNETPGVKGWSSSSSWSATYLSSPSSSNTFLSFTMLNNVREDTAIVTALLGLGCKLKASKCLQQL